MISLLFAAVLIGLTAWMFTRKKAAFLAAFFVVFQLVTRTIDITYIDIFGPVFASELGRYIGGGVATPIFVVAGLAFLVPLVFVFRDNSPAIMSCRVRSPWQLYHDSFTKVALVIAAATVGVLYGNMLLVGSIPLLEGTDRLEYNLIAGDIHNKMYGLNFLLNFLLGAMTVLPRLNQRDYDLRFSAIFAALLLYWVFTGNRFSVFFVQCAFYFMPFAAVLLGRDAGVIGDLGPTSIIQRILASRISRVLGIAFAFLCVGGLIANSYYNVRSYRDPLQQIEERILVQPVELWAATWERVDFGGSGELYSRDAVDGMFINPIDSSRNTSIQYLMTKELGYFRAAELARYGQQYNGGYPEIHFELFNPWLALLILPFIGLMAALLIRFCIILLYRNMVMSSVLAAYIFYGFSLHYIGGMFNFVLEPSFTLKIVALIACYIWERQFAVPDTGGTTAAGLSPPGQFFAGR